jgi:hypothetical protein
MGRRRTDRVPIRPSIMRIPTLLVFLLMLLAPLTATAADDTTTFSRAEARAELRDLYRELAAAHFDLYARRSRSEYDACYRRLRAAIDGPMTRPALERLLRRFVAYGNVAHARIDLPMGEWETFRQGGGKALPLQLRVTDGAAYVLADYSGEAAIAPGDRVLSVDGVAVLDWLQRLRAPLAADSDYMAHTLMESTLPLLAWLEFGEVASYALELQHEDGTQGRLVLPGATRAQFEAATESRPAAPAWDRREARMLDAGIAYLRPGPFYNPSGDEASLWDNTSFVQFVDRAFGDFIAADARALLIDLRGNPGGDNSFSDPMLAWIATRPFRFYSTFEVRSSTAARASNAKRLGGPSDSVSARYEAAYAAHAPGTTFAFDLPQVAPRAGTRFARPVFLLIDRHSYSNTVLAAAVAQDYGFATILGEETSDLASTYGAMESFALPRSGIVVGFPKARIVRPSGDDAARGVVPDVAIAAPPVDDDGAQMLERALAIVRERLAASR